MCISLLFLPACTSEKSLCILLAPDHAGNPMDSLPYVRALYWGHQNWTQDFTCNFFRAEWRGKKNAYTDLLAVLLLPQPSVGLAFATGVPLC